MFQCINWATTQYLICHYYKTILNVETLIILPNKVLCIFMQNSSLNGSAFHFYVATFLSDCVRV